MAILTTSNAFLIQQQAAEIQRTRDIMNRIGFVPQGGPQNTHGNVNRAVDLGHRTSIEQGPGNMASFAEGGPSFVEGLGIDLNGDGKFELGKDGHLALDLDGNGIYDRKDIQDTLDMLKIFSGDTTGTSRSGGGFNRVNQAELLLLQARGKQADLNQDGVLSTWELTRMGAKVLVGNADGNPGELKARELTRPQPQVISERPRYNPRPVFNNYPSFGAPMSFGPPAFFMHFLQSFMSFFARPF